MYRQIADHVEDVISYLKKYDNTEEVFYAVREQEWTALPKAEAAARTIFLNHTCFNGLYRVNKQGKFNVPYGKYKNPKICDEEGLYAASEALKSRNTLWRLSACAGALRSTRRFHFLDPPYLPISNMQILSDIRRNSFTKKIM